MGKTMVMRALEAQDIPYEKDIAGYVDQGVLELEKAIISSGRPDAGLALAPQDLLRAIKGAQVGDFAF